MMVCRFRFALCAITAAAASALVMPQHATFAGKPAPPPPLPHMRYQVQFWNAPNPGGGVYINQMNNHGQVVGWYILADGEQHGFLYTPRSTPRPPST